MNLLSNHRIVHWITKIQYLLNWKSQLSLNCSHQLWTLSTSLPSVCTDLLWSNLLAGIDFSHSHLLLYLQCWHMAFLDCTSLSSCSRNQVDNLWSCNNSPLNALCIRSIHRSILASYSYKSDLCLLELLRDPC